MMHAQRPGDESWLERHRRTWRAAKAELPAAWGADPVTVVVVCTVSGARRMAARPAC